MTASTARFDPGRRDEYAVGYTANGDPVLHAHVMPEGGLGLYSSAEDLLRYGMYHAGTDSPSRRVSPSPAQPTNSGTDPAHGYFHLGWWMSDAVRVSNGSVRGANAHLSILPDDELVVVVLTNQTSNFADEVAGRIIESLVPGVAEKGARARAEYARLFRTPYSPRADWSGVWSGVLRTPRGETPLIIELVGEQVTVRIAAGAPLLLENPSLNEFGELRGSLEAVLPGLTPVGNEAYPIRLMLRLRDGRPTGYVSAIFDLPGGNVSLPASVPLERVRADPD